MVHIGSQVTQVEAFDQAFKKLPGVVQELRAQGYKVERLDIGGGFPVRYQNSNSLLDLDAYAAWVRDIIVPLETDIALEPGRYLVANSGVLLTQVIDVKTTSGQDFLILDAAMNDLLRPAMYDAYHEISPVRNHKAPLAAYDIVGPICETGDTFARTRTVPQMQRGDLAVVQSAGAYGMCMSSNYNTRPRAAEILVDGSNYAEINAREGFDELMAREHVPAWL
jgi:diaminopimelate decarboxylase